MTRKPYVQNIRESEMSPHLGVFEGEISTWDASGIGSEVEIIRFGKGRGKLRTRNRDALMMHPNIKCAITNDLDQATLDILATLPRLEQLHLSHCSVNSLHLSYLEHCKMVVLSGLKNLTNLNALTNMPALESIFVTGPKTIEIDAIATLNLRELALWCSVDGNNLAPLSSLKRLEYLCIGRFQPLPDELSQLSQLAKLQLVELNSNQHPFEMYAELDSILPKGTKRNWNLLTRLHTTCEVHEDHPLLQASGCRQRPFCEKCKPNRLQKLINAYARFNSNPLKTPPVQAERHGMSKDGRTFDYFN